jgi:hypothetical protein
MSVRGYDSIFVDRKMTSNRLIVILILPSNLIHVVRLLLLHCFAYRGYTNGCPVLIVLVFSVICAKQILILNEEIVVALSFIGFVLYGRNANTNRNTSIVLLTMVYDSARQVLTRPTTITISARNCTVAVHRVIRALYCISCWVMFVKAPVHVVYAHK